MKKRICDGYADCPDAVDETGVLGTCLNELIPDTTCCNTYRVDGYDYEYIGMESSKPKYYSSETTNYLIYLGGIWYYSQTDLSDVSEFKYFYYVTSADSCPPTSWSE